MSGKNKSVIIVEDELFIGFEVENILKTAGYEVVGPIGRLKEALQTIDELAANSQLPVGAFLDGNLDGAPVDAIAEALASHKVPFVFLSGYGRKQLPGGYEHIRLIEKPFRDKDVLDAAQSFDRKDQPT